MMAMYAEIAEKFQNLNFARLFLRNGFIQHKIVFPFRQGICADNTADSSSGNRCLSFIIICFR